MSNPFVIGNTYTFSTYAPALIGDTHRNMKALAILSYEMAKRFTQPDVRHASIYPYLESGGLNVANDPKVYTYILFKNPAGDEAVFALEWINTATVLETNTYTLVIEIPNAKPGDDVYYKNALLMAGAVNVIVR